MYKIRPSLKLSLKLSATVLVAVGSLLVFGIFHPLSSHATAGINQQLNYQGRLLDNTGAVVADGTYNMEFKIYQDGAGCVAGGTSPCGGTLKWTEDWIQTNRVTVKNGYFSVNLGSLTAFAALIDWNQDTLWLSTNIGGVTNTPTPTWDGEMTPFKRISSSPYALNSGQLGGLASSSFIQLAKGVQTDASTTAPSIFINKTNASLTPNILELQRSGTDVMTVDNNGGVAFAPQSTGNITFAGDNDSNVAINSTFTGTGPTQTALAISLTDNATAAGTSYGLSVTNADNTTNAGVPAALAYLKNANAAETVVDGLLVEQTGAGTMTNGLEVKQTAGAITNGLTFTGTFGSVLKVGATTVINASGQIPTAQLTGNFSFANISAATNANALVIGTGGSLGASGTGTITATNLGCTDCVALTTETTGNYVASVANGTGLTGGAAGSEGATLTLGIDQTAGLTWTGTEAFNGATSFTPSSTNSVTLNGDNDSNVAINSTFTGTGPTQTGLAITLTDNATAAGTSYGLSVTNADNTTNAGVPAALAYLKNANAAETVPDGLLVEQTGAGALTSGLEVKQTAGTVVNGLTLTGTFTKLINSTNFNVTGAGAGTFASTLNVNGTTFSLGNGTASTINTPSGNAGLSIIPNGSGALNLATTNTGNVAIGNTTGTFGLVSNGGLNVTTTGALTGVASLDTINTSATALSFAGTGMVSSGTGSDIALGNQIALRPGVDAGNGLTIQNAGATATVASFGTNTSNPNLIANPSLEANANGWAKKGNVATTATSSDDFAQYGRRSLKIVTTATAADGASYAVPLKASTQYTLSAWVRVSTGTATTLNLNRQDNGTDVDTCTSGNGIAMSVNTAFAQFTCTFTTGATVNGTTNVYVKQTDAPVGGRTIYVDGVTLLAGASGLTYDAGGSGLNLQTVSNGLTLNGTDSGDVQPWQVSSTPLTTALRYGDGVQANGYIYYVGGCTGACGAGTSVATVYYAKMNADGSMGAWSAATSIPAARYGLTTYVSNGYIYVVGGDSGVGALNATPQSTVYYSKLNGDGTVGTWQTSINPLPATREFHTSAVTNGFAYVIGGDSAGAQSTAYYAKMYADGSTSPWNTTTALTTGAAARREATTVTANGNIYVIGGDTGGTAQSTVYYNSINSDGTLGTTWNTTTALNVGGAQPRRFLTSVVANGYVYAIGGDNGTAAQTTVYYAHLLPDGTIGAWQATTNPLPAGRYGSDSVIVNGYIYEIGGYDGTNPQATPYYASTARILIGGSLDLVGLGGGSISASAGAGSITAGSIRAVGGLTVDGSGDFNNGISVDSVINLNAVSANTGQTVFNINNFNSNSIFSIRHMNSTFGSLANGGAFIDNMSYIGQEFDKDTTVTAAAVTTGTLVGDDLGWFAKGSAAGVTYQTPRSTNGIAVINMPTTTTTSGILALGSNVNVLNNIVTAANLPVIQIKMATTLNAASSDIYWGVENGTVAAPTTNDTPPSDGFFFWNNNAAGGWQGMVRSTAGGTIGTVNCPGAVSVTANHYATGRIEVLDATHVHFMIDNDSTDGVNFVDCGTVTGTLPTAQMAPFIENNQSAAQGAAHVIDVDYVRVWQDDSDPTPTDNGLTAVTPQDNGATDSSASADTSTINDSSADTTNTDQTTPLTNNSPEDGAVSTLIDFAAASSDDTLFSHDVYVAGTLYANKIVANQIEGMDVITDQIKSLSDELAKQQSATKASSKTGLSGAGSSGNGKVSFTNVSAVNLTVLAQIEIKGGLVVDGDAQFNGKTLFQLAAEFDGPVNINGQVTYNSDAGGTAIIHGGDQKVTVKFSKDYTSKPIIIANWLLNDTKDSQGNVDSSDAKQQRLLDGGYSYSVANITTKGFDIILNKKAGEDVDLSWIANAIKNAQISQSSSGSSL